MLPEGIRYASMMKVRRNMKNRRALKSALKFSQNRRSGERCEKGRAFLSAPFARCDSQMSLLEVLVDEPCHLEHGNLLASAEHGAEVVIGVDHATVLRILKSLTLDVGPQFLRHFRARNRMRFRLLRASCALGVIGFMNAALGTRFVADFFFADFLRADFLGGASSLTSRTSSSPSSSFRCHRFSW